MMTLERQTNYQTALEYALRRARGRDPEVLVALGAVPRGVGSYDIPVLDAVLTVDLRQGSVALAGSGQKIGLAWQILVVHYLCGNVVPLQPQRWVSFADLVDARGYESVYRGRVLQRLCATAGRNRGLFVDACLRLGAERVTSGDEAFQFKLFPRLPVIVAWYDGDDELPPSVSFVYPDHILALLPAEDVIVLSEGLVGRLQGKDW